MSDEVLIIFLKYPAKGGNKTRIAATLGDDFTLGLYSCFINDILTMVGSITADKILALDIPDDTGMTLPDFGTGYPVIRQSGKDLGERMHNAFSSAFESGYSRAVIIGSDSPDLPSEFIENSFESLKHNEAVIGPVADGGYYLIGFTKESCRPEFFNDINWSTSSVFNQTIEKLKAQNIIPELSPLWYDIDNEDDIRAFYKRNLDKGMVLSHTMTYMSESINSGEIKIK